ncbi:MAG: leucine-rich repeat domain-containing protein [Clostridia bacterium]|nr:leucine-rich repeat domain-containing protein [Clostridia bacterium]
MKRKLALIAIMTMIFVSLLAINISAEETQNESGIYCSDSNEYGTVNIIDGYDYSSKLSLESRTVLDNGDGTYSTYPTAYLLDYNKDGSKRGERFQYFDPSILNDETGFTYSHASVIRMEIPEGITIIHHDDRANININTCDSMIECTFPSTLATFTKGDLLNGCDSLVKVDFSKATKVITTGGSALANCPLLTEVILPPNLTTLNSSTFENCVGLAAIELPSSIVTVGQKAFKKCTSLTSVTMADTVKNFGNECFSGCTALVEIALPKSLTSIPQSCFSGCSSLTTVTGGDSATYLGNYAFNGCAALTTVNLSNAITSIGGQGFYGCKALVEITLPASLTSLGNKCFQGCTSLTSIVIPNGVTQIQNDTFNGCSVLASVSMGDNVTSIGGYAFNGCSSLTSIDLSSAITSIGAYSFGGCAFTQLEMPEALETIEHNAFRNVPLTSVSFSSALKTIDNQAFYSCKSLQSVTFEEGLTTLGKEAFAFCSALTEISLPKSLTNINTYTFNNCTSIIKITIPQDSQLSGVLNSNFNGCSSLTSIHIPCGVTELSGNVFSGCSALSSITFGDGLEAISGTNNFKSCTSLTTLDFPNTLKSIADSNLNACTNLTELRLGDALEYLGVSNLQLKALKRVYLPSTITSVGAKLLGGTNSADSSTNITFIFTGDYNQALALRALVRADTTNTANASKLYNAEMVYAGDYDVNSEPSGYHFVYSYSKCDAFYDSHIEIPLNACVNQCERCLYYIALPTQSHNFEGGETIVYISYMESGTKTTVCQNEGCGCDNGSSETVPPIFKFLGYSIYEVNSSFLAEYTVDLDALEEYERVTGKKLQYGVVAASVDNLGGIAPLDPYTAKPVELNTGVVKRYIASRYSSPQVSIRIENISEARIDTLVFACGYVFDGAEVQYISKGATTKLPDETSYGIVRGPISTQVGSLTYSTVEETTPSADRVRQQAASEADYNAGSSLSSSELQGSGWLSTGILGKAKLIATGGSLLSMPAASALMKHYLDNTGTVYNIDVASFLKDDSGALASRNTAINNALRASELLAREGETLTVNQTAEGHPMQGSLATQNWQYAIGSYFDDVDVKNLTVTTVNGVKTYTADITYIVTDYYNWDTNDYNKFKNIVSPHDLHELHKAGLAREFLSYGEITYSSVTWTEGQTVADLGI